MNGSIASGDSKLLITVCVFDCNSTRMNDHKKLSSPSPQPLSPPDPNPTKFQPQKGQKGTGADTII